MKEPLIYVLILIFSTFIFVAIVAFSKWRELSLERELRKLVTWSVLWDHPFGNEHGHDLPLWSYISNAQIELQLSKAGRISGDDEWAYAKEIIEAYQNDLTISYFKGYLKVIKSKYVIHGEDYFMFMLYAFLSDHQCDYEFLKHEMHEERLSYKRYGDWGGPLYDAAYSLTEFAMVFHKMHYITYMYCRGSEILRDFVPEWNEKNLKEILDKKQIQISRI